MAALIDALRVQAVAFSWLEAAAVLLAVAYLLLAIRESIWCWLCAAVSSAIFVYLMAGKQLYMEAVLNAYYFVIAVYGWRVWLSGHTAEHELPVAVWSLRIHAAALAGIAVAVLVTGYFLDTRTREAMPYLDSLTTWSAVWATFLVARKVLENWWYWLVIDIVSIYMYLSRDLQLTALLFVVYVIMIPFGLAAWTGSRREAMAT
jgi:nicotinamide mononucleotide transporter